MGSGPIKAYDLNPVAVRVGTDAEGQPVTATMQVSVPLGEGKREEEEGGCILSFGEHHSLCWSGISVCWTRRRVYSVLATLTHSPLFLLLLSHHSPFLYSTAGRSNAPLVLISAGFLLEGGLYRSYATELATWGYAALVYDLSLFRDDKQTVAALR
jgi:hypothetical protein